MSDVDATDQEIVEALEKLVSDQISAGTSVILEAGEAPSYYIQFALEDDRVFCEAVSNQYLEPEDQLDESQLRVLENLGWREPEYEAQNWFRTFRPTRPEDYSEIVTLVRRAFTEVYGLSPDAPIALSRSWDGQVVAPEMGIHFASEGHRSAYEEVVRFAAEMYGDALELDARRPVFFIRQGSTIVRVAVSPVDIHSSIIDFYSWIVREPETTPELMHWLLRSNYRLRIGSLALDSDGDVLLRHSILGDTVTQDEFQLVMSIFAETADELDDAITSSFGGFTAWLGSPLTRCQYLDAPALLSTRLNATV